MLGQCPCGARIATAVAPLADRGAGVAAGHDIRQGRAAASTEGTDVTVDAVPSSTSASDTLDLASCATPTAVQAVVVGQDTASNSLLIAPDGVGGDSADHPLLFVPHTATGCR